MNGSGHTKAAIGNLGSKFMLNPNTAALGEEHGYTNWFAFYVAGRGACWTM
jgi:hypothetical protein